MRLTVPFLLKMRYTSYFRREVVGMMLQFLRVVQTFNIAIQLPTLREKDYQFRNKDGFGNNIEG